MSDELKYGAAMKAVKGRGEGSGQRDVSRNLLDLSESCRRPFRRGYKV